MRITYRTLGKLIDLMNDEQKDSDLTVEVEGSECFHAELRIASDTHNSLDEHHPVIFVNYHNDGSERTDDIKAIVEEIGLNC